MSRRNTVRKCSSVSRNNCIAICQWEGQCAVYEELRVRCLTIWNLTSSTLNFSFVSNAHTSMTTSPVTNINALSFSALQGLCNDTLFFKFRYEMILLNSISFLSCFPVGGSDLWCKAARLTHLVARRKNGAIWIFCICYGHQIFRESAETTILSGHLKLEEKSEFDFLKTHFDWERLDFAQHRILLLWDPIFKVFFAKANKVIYSSHFLQSKILKNFLEIDLPRI